MAENKNLRGKITALNTYHTDAYAIAVKHGFDGTEAEWLASLKGDKGDRGEKGLKGDTGAKGDKGDLGGTAPVVQTTGNSAESVMSQKAVTDELESIVEHTCNLFNKDSDDILNGFLSSKFYEDATYKTSHPIKVEEGVTYRWSVKHTDVGANAVKVAYLGDNGEFLPNEYGYVSETAAEWYDDTRTSMVFTAKKTGYVRVNIGDAKYLNTCMFCRADLYPNEYVPFALFVKPLVRSENLRGAMPPEWLAEIGVAEAHLLAGKKATFNGDSICAGAGYGGGYAKIIAEVCGMTVQNIGVGGGTIAAEQYNGEKARHWICRTIANMDADADYAIIEGGVNDASLQVPIGTLSSGYNATLDDTTFYGAFESMLKQLLIRFAGKKVGYIAVHQMTSNYKAINDPETSYYWAAKKCCEKWGVPFCDLNISVPPFAYFSESGDAELSALRTTYTHNGDGWHPNEEGYKKYYVPKIEAWLKTL